MFGEGYRPPARAAAGHSRHADAAAVPRYRYSGAPVNSSIDNTSSFSFSLPQVLDRQQIARIYGFSICALCDGLSVHLNRRTRAALPKPSCAGAPV
jgi:hypothetical protein